MSARDTLIASMTGLMRRQGVAGSGLNALLEHSGVSRRTVYLNFPGGKQELVAEATRAAGREFSEMIRAADAGLDPARGVQLFIELWKAQLAATEVRAGCPLVAAVLGRSEAPAAADAAAAAIGDWRAILIGRLTHAGVEAAAAGTLATTIIAAVEGAVIMSMAAQSTAALDDVGDSLAQLIRLHLPTES